MERTQTRSVKKTKCKSNSNGRKDDVIGWQIHSKHHCLFSLLSIIEENVQGKARSSIRTYAPQSLTEEYVLVKRGVNVRTKNMLYKEGTDETNLVHDFLQNSVNKLTRYNLLSRVPNRIFSLTRNTRINRYIHLRLLLQMIYFISCSGLGDSVFKGSTSKT
jgi:hypothetical protein